MRRDVEAGDAAGARMKRRAASKGAPRAPGSTNAPKPESDIIQVESEAVRATLALWLKHSLPSANRIAAIAVNHLQEMTQRTIQAEKAKA